MSSRSLVGSERNSCGFLWTTTPPCSWFDSRWQCRKPKSCWKLCEQIYWRDDCLRRRIPSLSTDCQEEPLSSVLRALRLTRHKLACSLGYYSTQPRWLRDLSALRTQPMLLLWGRMRCPSFWTYFAILSGLNNFGCLRILRVPRPACLRGSNCKTDHPSHTLEVNFENQAGPPARLESPYGWSARGTSVESLEYGKSRAISQIL